MLSAADSPFSSIIVTILAISGAWILRNAYINRSRVRSLRAKGIPIASHSLIFGHLRILFDYVRAHPPDASIYILHDWLAENYSRYFFEPLNGVPPVVYLDLWPVAPAFALVYDAVAATQFTRVNNLPKFVAADEYIRPLTSNLDIITAKSQLWKSWRTRLNPGFSSRNILALLPNLIEEVSVFVDVLQGLSGGANEWGPVFPLLERTMNLTFDIICRATLLHEQTNESSSPLKIALFDQIRLMSQAGIRRWMPSYWVSVAKNNQALRKQIHPHIVSKLQQDPSSSKALTIIDLAIKHDKDKVDGPFEVPPSVSDDATFIETLISNVKAFLFAGHDTTASTICFMMKCLQDNPTCLANLRSEHDTVVGLDPLRAASVLKEDPHLLNELPYTIGVIKETLRLYPIAATIRQGTPGSYITASGSTIRYPLEGFAPWVAISRIQRDPSYWVRPNEFLPERWAVGEDNPLYPSKDAWIPFSLAPRNCIGMQLAIVELELVCVLTARRFDIREAWEEWDKKLGVKATPTHMVNGHRLYAAGVGPVRPKDGMAVQVRDRYIST
ncbi:vera protein [Annulohypoxylon truncatum]|uniref:vera protein n=1 Tax=Annulohypoxylon truncatum TaxID=327061 RepID=UPI0020082C71|nr:vera protein [Annulohypoxylon truncatum]KAI1207438.1 vera protein [Annulohypoxylon truncatum]